MHTTTEPTSRAANVTGDLSPEHPFDADTRVEPITRNAFNPAFRGAPNWRATISDRWSALGGEPNGGYLLALCLSALAREMPFPHPLVASAFFLRRGAPGRAELTADVVRSGRRSATGEVALSQAGNQLASVTATFGDLERADGRTLVLERPPRLPPVEECVDPLGGNSLPGVTIADRVEYRQPELPGWTRGAPTGEPRAELWMRSKEPREPDVAALSLLVDAAAPAVMEIGEGGSSTLQLTVHLRGIPAPGWLACRVATRYVIGGYHEEDFEIWDSTGKLVAQSRQLAVLKQEDRVGRPG